MTRWKKLTDSPHLTLLARGSLNKSTEKRSSESILESVLSSACKVRSTSSGCLKSNLGFHGRVFRGTGLKDVFSP
jgi:hypothetical protein